jgi:hypothetical protein
MYRSYMGRAVYSATVASRPYLVVYDWACGQLMSATPMPDEAFAAGQRDAVASAYADDPAIEVTIVQAASPGDVHTASRGDVRS